MRHQLFLQHAAGLNKETSIDRFVRYLHALVGRELPLQVERRQNPRDRRVVLIDLTNRAERILAKLSLAHRNETRKFAPLLIEDG